jgi:hypothetical protein
MVVTTLMASRNAGINETASSSRSNSNTMKDCPPSAMLKTPLENDTNSDRQERVRTSFASFKEDRSAIAQSFVDSKVSSYAHRGEAEDEAVVFDDSRASSPAPQSRSRNRSPLAKYRVAALKNMVSSEYRIDLPMSPLTHPHSELLGVCPCEGFQGWKGINVRGKLASRSFGDLRILKKRFEWDPEVEAPAKKIKAAHLGPGNSQLESLPIEILGGFHYALIWPGKTNILIESVIGHLLYDLPPTNYAPRNSDLVSLLRTSRTLHSVTLDTLYKNITIPHSKIFRKFIDHVAAHPALGTLVRRLDFSHFNPTGSGITARQRAETMNLTQETLLQCLKLVPNLKEFLAQEHIDNELSTDVLRTLLGMEQLRAVDFCAASSGKFRDAWLGVVRSTSVYSLPSTLSITRLSFHECTILPSSVFDTLLPKLVHLTHLDVQHTRITDSALASLPQTARLTHLNLSKCSSLSGDAVVKFLATHNSAKGLVYLNLMMDAKSHEMLDAADLTALLPCLPQTLKSLNLKGSKMRNAHVKLLRPLITHLEELGLGRTLSYIEIAALILSPVLPDEDDLEDVERYEREMAAWTPHSLRYIDISDLTVQMMDMGEFFGLKTSLLRGREGTLEVIELEEKLYSLFSKRTAALKTYNWCVRDAGRRGWLVKDTGLGGDDGARSWKAGATYWGMRKVPVARQEVGGMYGLYMFKR